MSENDFGIPNIEIGPLRIWVHGREHPDAGNSWDANWLRTTAHCGAKGAEMSISGAFLTLPEIDSFATECERVARDLSGEAHLGYIEPELRVNIKVSDKLGHLLLTVDITPDYISQRHRFESELDQSYLTDLIRDCRKLLDEYGIKGTPI